MEKILVIEDDRAVQRALKRLFESEGYGVDSRYDGPAGLEAFRASPPAVVVLDLRLPGCPASRFAARSNRTLPTCRSSC